LIEQLKFLTDVQDTGIEKRCIEGRVAKCPVKERFLVFGDAAIEREPDMHILGGWQHL